MNVLVFCPVWMAAQPETVQAIFSLHHNGPISQLFQRENLTGNGHQDTLHQYQRGREAFLSGPYDAMLVIEDDIIPPPDTLERLIALNADMAYGVYVFRQSRPKWPVVNIFERYDPPGRNTGESLSVWPEKYAAAVRQGVVPCSGGGLGCVLIKRHVLEAIPFRLEQPNGPHCDSYFTDDVFHAGWTMMADMRVRCGHKRRDTGEILWPS